MMLATTKHGLAILLPAIAACTPVQYESLLQTPTAAGWLLIAPPSRWVSGAVRLDDRAPLWEWTRLGAFDEQEACERFRDVQIARAPDDEAWATWSMSRCATTGRAERGRLPPGE